MATKVFNTKHTDDLIEILKVRFEKYANRHKGISWKEVADKLEKNPGKLYSLHKMEASGGEPDVIGKDETTGELLFCDCSAESPKGRRSVCYDREGLESRKEHPPKNSAIDMAEEMAVELMSEEEYRALQNLGSFDSKTSSWIQTPPEIRNVGGAIFGDFRYEHVFIYHNGAQSYYGSRGFRGILRV